MKKPMITAEALHAAKAAGLVSEVPLEKKPDGLIAAHRVRSRLADYLNHRNTDPAVLASMIAEYEVRKVAEYDAKEIAARVGPIIEALEAYRDRSDLRGLKAAWNTLLSDADWNVIERQAVQPKARRGRPQTPLMPVLHMAHLDYLDRRDLLRAQQSAATTNAERQRVEDLQAVLFEAVAREWREAQQLHKVEKDRLVTAENLELVVDNEHNAYRAWLTENALPFPE
jgi:hypothetical protein